MRISTRPKYLCCGAEWEVWRGASLQVLEEAVGKRRAAWLAIHRRLPGLPPEIGKVSIQKLQDRGLLSKGTSDV